MPPPPAVNPQSEAWREARLQLAHLSRQGVICRVPKAAAYQLVTRGLSENEGKSDIEELKNPKPSVKEQEIALTEQVKRESILAETRLKNQLAVEKHQKEMDVLVRASTVREGIQMLKAANSIPNDTSKSDERTTGEN
jgi:hypothetical protein